MTPAYRSKSGQAVQSAKLVGLFHPTVEGAGFLLPVFESNEQTYAQVVQDDYVLCFELAVFDSYAPIPNRKLSIGMPAVAAFRFPDGDVVAGTFREVEESLFLNRLRLGDDDSLWRAVLRFVRFGTRGEWLRAHNASADGHEDHESYQVDAIAQRTVTRAVRVAGNEVLKPAHIALFGAGQTVVQALASTGQVLPKFGLKLPRHQLVDALKLLTVYSDNDALAKADSELGALSFELLRPIDFASNPKPSSGPSHPEWIQTLVGKDYLRSVLRQKSLIVLVVDFNSLESLICAPLIASTAHELGIVTLCAVDSSAPVLDPPGFKRRCAQYAFKSLTTHCQGGVWANDAVTNSFRSVHIRNEFLASLKPVETLQTDDRRLFLPSLARMKHYFRNRRNPKFGLKVTQHIEDSIPKTLEAEIEAAIRAAVERATKRPKP